MLKFDERISEGEFDTHPLVSVIIATYRRDYSLEKALLSLENQTYKKIEIIVIDDNADELWNKKVCSIIDKIRCQFRNNIIYIKNEINMGSAATRNTGINNSSGEYITFLDDDDIYLKNKIKSQLEHMLENNSDFSITDLHLYDENEKLVEKRNRNYLREYRKIDLLRYHFMYHMTGTDTMMFRRDYLIKINGFTLIDVGDEFYLMQKAIEAGGNFSYLPNCDIKAYVHTISSGLSSGESKISGENSLYEYKKKFFSQLGRKEIRYINMRHYAVLAYAEIRKRNFVGFSKNSFYSFYSSPYHCIKLFLSRK